MVRNYKDQELLDRVKSLPSFKGIPKGRWILGVRSTADITNVFDDKFYYFDGETFVTVLTGTTNPGLNILRRFEQFNKMGAAVIKSDQWYYNVWQYGMHRGRMPGLLQVGAEVIVYRDGNKDGKSEEKGKTISGFYGINHHTNTYNWSPENMKVVAEDIGAWSAGCQVVNQRQKFADMMEWFAEAKKSRKQMFVTYCLIKEF